jgi:hypothetical protein
LPGKIGKKFAKFGQIFTCLSPQFFLNFVGVSIFFFAISARRAKFRHNAAKNFRTDAAEQVLIGLMCKGVAYAKPHQVHDLRKRGARRVARLELAPSGFAGGRQARQDSYFVHQ